MLAHLTRRDSTGCEDWRERKRRNRRWAQVGVGATAGQTLGCVVARSSVCGRVGWDLRSAGARGGFAGRGFAHPDRIGGEVAGDGGDDGRPRERVDGGGVGGGNVAAGAAGVRVLPPRRGAAGPCAGTGWQWRGGLECVAVA